MHWTWDPILQYLRSKTETYNGHGPNFAILAFQTKINTRLGTQPSAIPTFQAKTCIEPRTQPCDTDILKQKHTLDMRPMLIIPVFKTNNYM